MGKNVYKENTTNKKKITQKIFFIMLIITCILGFSNTNYARYKLTRNLNFNISSAPFIFTATANKATVDMTSANAATFEITIKNNDGTNYNKYDTKYEISIDNSRYSLKLQDANNGVIKGGSIKENKITATLSSVSTEVFWEGTINVKIKSTSPYIKEITIPIAINIPTPTITVNANYKIKLENATIYTNKLEDAYDQTISGGGDEKGGTITVLRDVIDTVSVERTNSTQTTNRSIIVTKSIAIDTNGVNLTLRAPINLDSEKLQIKGNGQIYCTADAAAIKCFGGELETIGTPDIICYGVGIQIYNDTKVTLNGGHVIGEGRSGLQTWGSGDIVINGAYIIGIPRTKNGITVNKDATCAITIKGNSVIANGISDSYGIGGTSTTGRGSSISFQGTAKPLTITDNAIVTAGKYSAEGMALYAGAKVNVTGNASVYSCMASVGHAAFRCNETAESLTIDTTGTIGSNTNGIISGKNTSTYLKNLIVKKGKFATITNHLADILNANSVSKPTIKTATNKTVAYKYLSPTYVLTDENMANYYYEEY